MNPRKILFADDDPEIREVLRLLLKSEGYEVVEASDGNEVLHLMDESVDLMILDVMMPGLGGYGVCSEIRKRSAVPILFLTAKSQDSDKTLGFSVGGDDYLVKPFSCSEIISRVKALLRRYCEYGAKNSIPDKVISLPGGVELDPCQCVVKQAGADVALTDIEYRILLLLATNPKKVFSIQNIYESVWNEPFFYSCNNTVMVHIRNIRRKLGDDNQNSRIIQNVWGRGYRVG